MADLAETLKREPRAYAAFRTMAEIFAAREDGLNAIDTMFRNGIRYLLFTGGEPTRLQRVFFHTDCAQAYGKIPLDVNEMKIDLMSISGHKIYGPKGSGGLFVRHKSLDCYCG